LLYQDFKDQIALTEFKSRMQQFLSFGFKRMVFSDKKEIELLNLDGNIGNITITQYCITLLLVKIENAALTHIL
jgi:hypothetical protein